MDKASIFGICIGFVLVLSAIVLGGDILVFLNIPGLLIVAGGTLGAVSVAFPANELKHIIPVSRRVFNDPGNEMTTISEYLQTAMRTARTKGMIELERVAEEAPTEPLRKGLQLVADGLDLGAIRQIFVTEQVHMEKHHRMGQKIFTEMGKAAPAFGMVGTLIGLVQMLSNLSDPAAIGPAMAVALLTTFYGAVASNVIFLPMVTKLDRRIHIEVTQFELTLVGLECILRGDNAATMREKLQAFLVAHDSPAGDAKAADETTEAVPEQAAA